MYGESMGKPCSCTQFIISRIFYCKSRENPYQYCESRENPYQVLQVTQESVSGTTSHVRCVWTCNEIEGSYDKIIITIVPSYTGTNITSLLPLALLLVLRTRNNTDGNKLVIFSGIALYYGDNYINSELRLCSTFVETNTKSTSTKRDCTQQLSIVLENKFGSVSYSWLILPQKSS